VRGVVLGVDRLTGGTVTQCCVPELNRVVLILLLVPATLRQLFKMAVECLMFLCVRPSF